MLSVLRDTANNMTWTNLLLPLLFLFFLFFFFCLLTMNRSDPLTVLLRRCMSPPPSLFAVDLGDSKNAATSDNLEFRRKVELEPKIWVWIQRHPAMRSLSIETSGFHFTLIHGLKLLFHGARTFSLPTFSVGISQIPFSKVGGWFSWVALSDHLDPNWIA